MASWTTMAHVRAWAAVSDEEWVPVATALGDMNLDSILLVGAMPPHLLTTALAAWITTSAATPLSQLRMAMLVNAARLKLGMDLVDVQPGPTGSNPTSTAASSGDAVPPTGALTITGVKVKLSQVVDQGSDQEVAMLSVSELTTMRQRFITTFGDPPLQMAEVTDAQLTALHYKFVSGQAPYADFGVWGPYGARIERRLKFTSYTLTPGGVVADVGVAGSGFT